MTFYFGKILVFSLFFFNFGVNLLKYAPTHTNDCSSLKKQKKTQTKYSEIVLRPKHGAGVRGGVVKNTIFSAFFLRNPSLRTLLLLSPFFLPHQCSSLHRFHLQGWDCHPLLFPALQANRQPSEEHWFNVL